MNNVAASSLALLKYLINHSSQNRVARLLLNQNNKNNKQFWHMYLPSCFYESLDIRETEKAENKKIRTILTQGTTFNFKPGAVIYDTKKAYGIWFEAIKEIKLGIQILESNSAIPSPNQRYPGSVTFNLLIPNKKRTRLMRLKRYTLTQDDFIKLLIIGPSPNLLSKNTSKRRFKGGW